MDKLIVRGSVLSIDKLAQLNSKGEVVITINDLSRAVNDAAPSLKPFLQARSE